MTQGYVLALTDNNQQISEMRGAIREVVGDLNVENWFFPGHAEGDGCLGKLCVSIFDKIAVPNADKPLALHMTFEIPSFFIPSLNGLKRGDPVKVTVRNLHLTIRPQKTQVTISEINAASIITAGFSAHRGANNDWTYKEWNEERLKSLAAELLMTANTKLTIVSDLNQALRRFQGVPYPYLTEMGVNIVKQLSAQIAHNLDAIRPPNVPAIEVQVTTQNWG
jgi:hypothetical protein